jgi:acetyltransferase-like isoleucine patch superfamily enzyme
MTISHTAVVSSKASIGSNVSIGDFTIISDNVIIGDNVSIQSHCLMGQPTPLSDGKPLIIGNDSLIRSHSIFYEGSKFGSKLMTGHRVTVREKIEAGENLLIGTNCDLQGHAKIGDYVRLYTGVQINHASNIGDFVRIYHYSVLTNDPHPPSSLVLGVKVNKYAVIATMCCILPGVQIGENALVGACSLVREDVEPETVVAGVPAKYICRSAEIKLKDGTNQPAYPWMRHFHRGYPKEITDEWMSIYNV